jgi:guanyl-specific ribonuclease Sa
MPPKSLRAKPIAALSAIGLAALTALALLAGPNAASVHSSRVMTVGEIRPVACSIPSQAWQTLNLINADEWPPNDCSGTKGGTTWTDREGTLPNSNSVRYQEWDVDRKQPGRSRDARRIVTGSDGTAWYTGDHYATFCRMR